jgi:hypothetical protein
MEQQSISKNDVARVEIKNGPQGPIVASGVTPTQPAKDPELFTLGKKYVPKTERNTETWDKITKVLADGPKTLAQIAEAIKGHGDFLGYMRRGGHVIPHVVEAAK